MSGDVSWEAMRAVQDSCCQLSKKVDELYAWKLEALLRITECVQDCEMCASVLRPLLEDKEAKS